MGFVAKKMIFRVFYAFFAGVFFAVLQICYFFSLETYLSSVYLTYFTVVIFWLIGVIVGLSLRQDEKGNVLKLVSIITIYIFYFLIKSFSFKLVFLGVSAPLISLSSLYAGYFFKEQGERFKNVKNLFFWENNGFILGFIISFIGFIKWGINFLTWAPIVSFFFITPYKTLLFLKKAKYNSFLH
jgi:hypothetical protein